MTQRLMACALALCSFALPMAQETGAGTAQIDTTGTTLIERAVYTTAPIGDHAPPGGLLPTLGANIFGQEPQNIFLIKATYRFVL